MPSTGEVMVQYERLSCAVVTCAFAASTEAAVLSKFPVASSRSFCDSASFSVSGFTRARFDFATSSAAWALESCAFAASSCAWNGFMSMRKSTCPAFTIEPSV